jgi:imidazolonepropionase-like amidohydrolase
MATSAAVGTGFHHETEILAEGGFSPLEIIQAATKWPADAANALSRVGTIETGKLAEDSIAFSQLL